MRQDLNTREHLARRWVRILATPAMRRRILRELERRGPLRGRVRPAQRPLSWLLDEVDAALDRQAMR